MPCKPKIEKYILNEKSIEKICDIYFSNLNASIEKIDQKTTAKCDAHEVKEIIRKEIDTDKGRGPQETHKVTMPKKVEVSSWKQSMRFKTERPGSLAS